MNITIHRNGESYGPYLIEDIKKYLKEGNLVESDLGWVDGATEWVPLSKIPGLVHTPAPPPAIVNTPVSSPLPISGQPSKTLPVSNAQNVAGISSKSFYIAWLLCLFFGVFGAHRFYLGKKKAILMLCTFGGLGIWVLYDLCILLLNKMKDGSDQFIKNPNTKLTWGLSFFIMLIGLMGHGHNGQSEYKPTTVSINKQSDELNEILGCYIGEKQTQMGLAKYNVNITQEGNVIVSGSVDNNPVDDISGTIIKTKIDDDFVLFFIKDNKGKIKEDYFAFLLIKNIPVSSPSAKYTILINGNKIKLTKTSDISNTVPLSNNQTKGMISAFYGLYTGITPSYPMSNKNGQVSEFKENIVTIPEINNSIIISESKIELIQKTSDGTTVLSSGLPIVQSESNSSITVQVELTDSQGNNPVVTIDIMKDSGILILHQSFGVPDTTLSKIQK